MSRKSSMLSAGYAAARPDRIVGNFWIGASSNRDRIRDDLMGLVAHSRKAARDNDHMRAFLNLVERHVIGPTGIALRMQVRDAGGGLDRNTNTAVETEFKRWARRGNCTVCGRHSLASLSRMAVRMSARDGQMFLRLYRGGGGYIDGGIECDPLGRPVAYHMFTVHPRSRLARRRERIRVPAAQIIHIGRVSDPEHLLSEPWAHTALRRLSQLSDLDESALAAARYGARKFGFFTRQADAMSPSPVEGDDQDEDTTEIGEWDTLPTGYDVANWDPKYPDQQLGPFAKHMLRAGAAGMGVSYAALTNDLEGANFSSLRAGQGEERDEWRVLQQASRRHRFSTPSPIPGRTKTMTTTKTTLEIPKTMQGRALAVEAVRAAPGEGSDEPSRVFDLTFSSEQPVERYFGQEVLGHGSGEIRMDWIASGRAPLLLDHRTNAESQIGVIESASITGGKGRARVRFSKSVRATEIMEDVASGERGSISVGYSVHALRLESETDDERVYRVTDWEPMEISLVTIPADQTVGLGRAREGEDTLTIPVHTTREKEAAMPVEDKKKEDAASGTRTAPATPKIDEAEIDRRADERMKAEMKRREDIAEMGQRFNMPTDHRDQAVRDGIPAAEYQGRVLEKLGDEDFQRAQTAHASVGLTDTEAKRFSFIRAARHLNRPTSRQYQDEAKFEIEVSEAAQAQYGRASKGILVPADVWGNGNGQRALSTGTATAAGNLVETELRATEFIDILRNQTVALGMGARAATVWATVRLASPTPRASGRSLSPERFRSGRKSPKCGAISPGQMP